MKVTSGYSIDKKFCVRLERMVEIDTCIERERERERDPHGSAHIHKRTNYTRTTNHYLGANLAVAS